MSAEKKVAPSQDHEMVTSPVSSVPNDDNEQEKKDRPPSPLIMNDAIPPSSFIPTKPGSGKVNTDQGNNSNIGEDPEPDITKHLQNVKGNDNNDSGSTKTFNELEAKLRAIEMFRQQSHSNLSKHKLAAIHLSSRQFYIFSIPLAVVAMASGILAFLGTMITSENTKSFLNIIVGSLSFLVVFLQTMSNQCKYAVRAEMHDSTAIDLRDLREDLENLVNELKMLHEFGSGGDNKANIVNDSNGEKGAQDSQHESLISIRKRYSQCLKGCKSTVPIEIDQAFNLLESEINTTLSNSGHHKLWNYYSMEYTNVIYFQAHNHLSTIFSSSWSWPLYLTDPKESVEDTMQNLKTTLSKGGEFWDKL